MTNQLSHPDFDITENDSRLTTEPIERIGLFNMYKLAQRAFWTVEEVTLSKDKIDFENTLSSQQRHFLKHILAFFATSDGIVNINLTKRFKEDVPFLEAQYFYDFQTAIENIHAEMYSLLVSTLIDDPVERKRLFDAVHNMPAIKQMADWMFKCIDSDASLAERLLRMACVEGIFFTGCFCAIYWFQEQGLMPGLAQSNEFIARDEGYHTQFALAIYTIIKKERQLSHDKVSEILKAAVNIASDFCVSALPEDMEGMNATLMKEYIRCQADNLAIMIDMPPPFGARQPFAFMRKQEQDNKTNFFERRVTEYSRVSRPDDGNFSIITDF